MYNIIDTDQLPQKTSNYQKRHIMIGKKLSSFIKYTTVSISFLTFFSVNGIVLADEPKNLEFTGVLIVPPPCSIDDDDGTLQIDFGDKVGTRKVSTGIYRQTIPLSISCEENNLAWQLQFSVTGNPASFDIDNATVVTPQQVDLGVKLYLDGQPFELDKPVKVNSSSLPVMEAVLVQRDGVELQDGEFTALATFRAEYQ